MILKLFEYPHSILRKKSEPVKTIKDKHLKLAGSMHYYMIKWNGIGLSAVQVGRLLRLIVMNCNGIKRTMFNPEIIKSSEKEQTLKEGCLSFPGKMVETKRPESIKVKYINETNNLVEEEFSGLPAVVILHEIDHLDGKLLIDKEHNSY